MYSISRTPTALAVKAPYNPKFNAAAKRDLGGRYKDSAWIFDLRDEEAARKLVDDYYGYVEGEPLCSVRATCVQELNGFQGPVVRLGRVLAAATGRDGGARLGDGVRLASGRAGSGGSMKNWATVIDEGTVLVMHDVPLRMAQRYVQEPGRNGVNVEVLDSARPAEDRSALEAERMRLMSRIADIETRLAVI